MSGSAKELLEKVDRLREAVGGDDPGEIGRHAFQVFSESLEVAGGESPVESIVKAIYDIIQCKDVKNEDIPDIVSKSDQFAKLKNDIHSIREFIFALANGDLSKPLAVKGYLAGVLKMFQSHLRQLTWQAQMVSRGDFTQRVNFMGEFSESFNLMVEQLDQADKEHAESKERYRRLAVTDPLTGLSNRRHFFEMASAEFARTKRQGTTLSVIMMDVDHFKAVNDNYGHYVGDIVLQSLAQQLQRAMRGSDLLGRYGGEEFVALLPETASQGAQQVADRIRRNIQAFDFDAGADPIKITVSFGVSDFCGISGCAKDIQEVIDKADKALYEAKRAGRNLVVVG